MLRFPCPTCDKTLKVAESFAGKKVRSPHCHEPARVPAPEPQVDNRDDTPGFFTSMSLGLRLAVASVAIAGGVGLLASILGLLLGEVAGGAHLGAVLAGCSFLVLLIMLHGHGTRCPRCRAWWSRCTMK